MLMQTLIFKHVHIPAQIKMDYNVRFFFRAFQLYNVTIM